MTTPSTVHLLGRLDELPVSATNRGAFNLALEILTASPSIRPDQVGSPWRELTAHPGAFTDADHTHHLHLGWHKNPPGSR